MARKNRKAIPDRTRFEVFKRDSFTCQYCGRKAPEVILQVDHIEPVAEGGADEILNYLTSCSECNAGKGARKLDDKTEVAKQRRQLEELNERRLQLEMMLQWRRGLYGLQEMSTEALVSRINELGPGWKPSESGLASIKRWLRDYPLSELLDAAEASAAHYLKWNGPAVTQESWNDFFHYIPRIAALARAKHDEPYLKDLLYVRAVLRNNTNWHWRARRDCMPLLKDAVAAGIDTEELKGVAKSVTSFDAFETIVEAWIKDAQGRPE